MLHSVEDVVYEHEVVKVHMLATDLADELVLCVRYNKISLKWKQLMKYTGCQKQQVSVKTANTHCNPEIKLKHSLLWLTEVCVCVYTNYTCGVF